jgi:hypothetical protein
VGEIGPFGRVAFYKNGLALVEVNLGERAKAFASSTSASHPSIGS